jgi:hypothetical protein
MSRHQEVVSVHTDVLQVGSLRDLREEAVSSTLGTPAGAIRSLTCQ